MTRPTLEVADIIRAAGNSFIERNRNRLSWPQLKVLKLSATAARQLSVGTSTGAPDAAIRPSPITRALWGVIGSGELEAR